MQNNHKTKYLNLLSVAINWVVVVRDICESICKGIVNNDFFIIFSITPFPSFLPPLLPPSPCPPFLSLFLLILFLLLPPTLLSSLQPSSFSFLYSPFSSMFLSIQGSLLMGLGGTYGVSGTEFGPTACKACDLLTVLLLLQSQILAF